MFDASTYGDRLFDVYDTLYPQSQESVRAAAYVAARTPQGGRVLELGVGTGRIALEMVDAGLSVHGVDASPRILEVLAEKAEGLEDDLTWAVGDFTEADMGGPYDTALVALNTLFMVPSQQGQISALANTRRHLRPGGRLVVEVYEPSRIHGLPSSTESRFLALDDHSMLLSNLFVDRVNQYAAMGQVFVRDGQMRNIPELSRYAFPSELDLMARMVGLELEERHEDWDGRSFDHRSERHISCYRAVDPWCAWPPAEDA
ncbi:class I SAM-dependent methyltransferase [Alteromonas gracilis]